MAIDQTTLGQHIADQMEAIEEDHGDDSSIGLILTIVEVIGPDGAAEIRTRSSDTRPFVKYGLLSQARIGAEKEMSGD
jgi:hypothetical protein